MKRFLTIFSIILVTILTVGCSKNRNQILLYADAYAGVYSPHGPELDVAKAHVAFKWDSDPDTQATR